MITGDLRTKQIKRLDMYGGEIKMEFNDNTHAYTVNGKKCVGVTTILKTINKPALIPWAVGEAIKSLETNLKAGVSYDEMQLKDILAKAKVAHREKKDRAATLGSLVHEWIESYIKGHNPEPPIHSEMGNAINAFLAWVKENNVKFTMSERIVYSRKFDYAGICDFTCEMGGRTFVGDIKTSNAIYNEYMMQVAAYRYAMEEEHTDEAYAGMMIIRIPKDSSEIEVKHFNDYEKHAKAFLHTAHLYRHLQSFK